MARVLNLLSDQSRSWADSDAGQQSQRSVFRVLVDLVNQKGDGNYAFVSESWLQHHCVAAGLDRNHTAFAIRRLAERGLVTTVGGRSTLYRITKRGWLHVMNGEAFA